MKAKPRAKPRRAVLEPVRVDAAWLKRNPLPRPDPTGDKDTRGTLLIVGGAVELPGAVLLAGIAALRAGGGKLQLATCRDVVPQVGTAVPEALVIALEQTRAGGIDASSASEIVRRAKTADSLLIGPGMVDQSHVDRIVETVLRESLTPVITLDAAALLGLAAHADLTARHAGRIVLTPHAGEMATMLGVTKDAVSRAPRAFAERAAEELGCVVVLKGPVTHVACRGERTMIYSEGGVGLATSGSGDTLAGIIAGLVARGTAPAIAAAWGVALHGAAGNVLARRIGPVGYLARELLDEIPRVMARASKRAPRAARG